jgi:two-component system response regulator MprA
MAQQITDTSGAVRATERCSAPRAIVAEDDPDCRLGLSVMLRDLGYEVTGARNGAEALAWYRSFGGAALVVTDVVMPRLDGLALARRLRALDPTLPLLAITGAGRDQLEELAAAGVRCLPKPFDRREFASAVRAATA